MSIKKAILFAVTLSIILLGLPGPKAEAAFNSVLEKEKTYSEILLLASDLGEGTIIFEKNANLKTQPASLAKIVVASIVLERCHNLDELVEAPAYAIDDLIGTNSSNVGIKRGEKLSVKDLLYCLLVASANDAANVLAHHVSGNLEDFVELMNEYVNSIGCKDTHFKNVHGLDAEGQHTTARDVLIFTKAASKYPIFEEITSTAKYTVPASNLSNARPLNTTVMLMNKGIKDYYYEYAKGIKTGTTKGAGHCVVSKASKDGYTYIAIVMQAPMLNIDDDAPLENCAFIDTKTMYKWVFEHIRLRTVVSEGQVMGEVGVRLSRQSDFVHLVPREEYRALMPLDDGKDSVLIKLIEDSLPEGRSVNAPVKKGDFLGRASVLYADEEVARIDLVAANDVKLSRAKYLGDMALRFTKTFTFKLIVSVAAFILLLILVLVSRRNVKKYNARKLKIVSPGKDFNKKKK
ncbi:MAG TPA: D-alanyl-D-alanine carboxypeptidase family protein [Clostridiales bacterium]|nr:D-alanyl-D-alanine carboxypeptidase family protein [Clostridiales bacterium]